jgi:hypothetical protein
MENTKIVLKNWENGEKFQCFFDPAKEFDIKNQAAFTFQDHLVSPDVALQRGFTVDPSYKLPAGVNTRIKCGQYIQEVLGISRQKNLALYFSTWKQLSEGLPMGDPDELRPHTTR